MMGTTEVMGETRENTEDEHMGYVTEKKIKHT